MASVANTKKSMDELLEDLEALQQISYLVDSKMTLSDILQKIAEMTARVMKADTCSILLNSDKKDELIIRAAYGLQDDMIDNAKLKRGQGLPGTVAMEGKLLYVTNAPDDPRFYNFPNSIVDQYKTFAGVPLYIREEMVGVMTVRYRENIELVKSDFTLFETIAKQVGIVIEKSRLYFEKIETERMAAIGLSLSEISHSIKNILSNMQGGLYILDRGLQTGDMERSKEAWDLVRRSNRKIANLVQNMLTFSRTSKPHMERDNLNFLIDDIYQSVERAAREKGVEVVLKMTPDVPDIFFDYDSLYNAVMNLVGNAIECIEEGKEGKVEVYTWFDQEHQQVGMSVVDNGPGISVDDLDKIFKLFYSTKGNRGTGIGLAVTRKIIEQHGGTIEVKSEVGEGTEFVVRLPVKQNAAGV